MLRYLADLNVKKRKRAIKLSYGASLLGFLILLPLSLVHAEDPPLSKTPPSDEAVSNYVDATNTCQKKSLDSQGGNQFKNSSLSINEMEECSNSIQKESLAASKVILQSVVPEAASQIKKDMTQADVFEIYLHHLRSTGSCPQLRTAIKNYEANPTPTGYCAVIDASNNRIGKEAGNTRRDGSLALASACKLWASATQEWDGLSDPDKRPPVGKARLKQVFDKRWKAFLQLSRAQAEWYKTAYPSNDPSKSNCADAVNSLITGNEINLKPSSLAPSVCSLQPASPGKPAKLSCGQGMPIPFPPLPEERPFKAVASALQQAPVSRQGKGTVRSSKLAPSETATLGQTDTATVEQSQLVSPPQAPTAPARTPPQMPVKALPAVAEQKSEQIIPPPVPKKPAFVPEEAPPLPAPPTKASLAAAAKRSAEKRKLSDGAQNESSAPAESTSSAPPRKRQSVVSTSGSVPPVPVRRLSEKDRYRLKALAPAPEVAPKVAEDEEDLSPMAKEIKKKAAEREAKREAKKSLGTKDPVAPKKLTEEQKKILARRNGVANSEAEEASAAKEEQEAEEARIKEEKAEQDAATERKRLVDAHLDARAKAVEDRKAEALAHPERPLTLEDSQEATSVKTLLDRRAQEKAQEKKAENIAGGVVPQRTAVQQQKAQPGAQPNFKERAEELKKKAEEQQTRERSNTEAEWED